MTYTNSTIEGRPSRQKLIDVFQEEPGFGGIILSTTAVGFGANVQAANYVTHFTRPWNSAKEDQARDRAYRLGQQRDVHVYYPTVVADGMTTFERTPDHLLSRKRALATASSTGHTIPWAPSPPGTLHCARASGLSSVLPCRLF